MKLWKESHLDGKEHGYLEEHDTLGGEHWCLEEHDTLDGQSAIYRVKNR